MITFLMQYLDWLDSPILSSTIIILGNVFALIVNFGVNVAYSILFVNRRAWLLEIPRWLIVANFLFFIVQLILLLK